MLKILQSRLQKYVNHELPDVQAGFRKGRGTRDQIANICWIIKKARIPGKNMYFCFIDYAKAFPVCTWCVFLVVDCLYVQAIQKGRQNYKDLIQKNIYFCFIDYAKAFDCVDHNKL